MHRDTHPLHHAYQLADDPAHPPPTLTRDQVREVDRLAIEELGIPGVVLMENAGANACHALLDHLRAHRGLKPSQVRAAVLCGGGNNGGDGYVIARHLHNVGTAVELYAFKPPDELRGDAAVHAGVCQRMGLPIQSVATVTDAQRASERWRQVNVVVDALLGTGFVGEVREPMATAIAAVNALGRGEAGVSVLAVDVPSGLDAETGRGGPAVVRADLTVTFVAAKAGFFTETARPHVGTLAIASIGTPPALTEHVRSV